MNKRGSSGKPKATQEEPAFWKPAPPATGANVIPVPRKPLKYTTQTKHRQNMERDPAPATYVEKRDMDGQPARTPVGISRDAQSARPRHMSLTNAHNVIVRGSSDHGRRPKHHTYTHYKQGYGGIRGNLPLERSKTTSRKDGEGN